MEFHVFPTGDLLNDTCAREIATRLRYAVDTNGQACLAVSGGNTPKGLFSCLSQQELPWNKVFVTLVDERWLPSDNEDSNAFLVKNLLLQNKAADAVFVSLYANCSIADAVDKIEKRVSALPPFDVVILGMGEDGHTASLFPCSTNIVEALSEENTANVMAIQPQTARYSRLTLTKQRLLQSEIIFLHLVGEKKRLTLQKALEHSDEASMPIRAFLFQNRVEVRVVFAPH